MWFPDAYLVQRSIKILGIVRVLAARIKIDRKVNRLFFVNSINKTVKYSDSLNGVTFPVALKRNYEISWSLDLDTKLRFNILSQLLKFIEILLCAEIKWKFLQNTITKHNTRPESRRIIVKKKSAQNSVNKKPLLLIFHAGKIVLTSKNLIWKNNPSTKTYENRNWISQKLPLSNPN